MQSLLVDTLGQIATEQHPASLFSVGPHSRALFSLGSGGGSDTSGLRSLESYTSLNPAWVSRIKTSQEQEQEQQQQQQQQQNQGCGKPELAAVRGGGPHARSV
eukprot:COSAG05_NODE_12456_length_467_cov_1.105978_1_plen_102_part_01